MIPQSHGRKVAASVPLDVPGSTGLMHGREIYLPSVKVNKFQQVDRSSPLFKFFQGLCQPREGRANLAAGLFR